MASLILGNMAGRLREDRSSAGKELAGLISAEHEYYCLLRVEGYSQPQAAEMAGFSPTSAYGIEIMPRVQNRIKQLANERSAEGPGNRSWVTGRLVEVASRLSGHAELSEGMRTQLSSAVTALMSIARLRGYVVERKQIKTATIDLNKLSRSELSSVLDQHLGTLSPASRRRIQQITAGDDLEGVAEAVDVSEPDSPSTSDNS